MRRLGALSVLVLLLGVAAWSRQAPVPPPPPLPRGGRVPARLTTTLDSLTLPEAITRLATLLGFPVRLPNADAGTPSIALDLARRRRLNWKDTPTGEALREFCRVYACRLGFHYPEGYVVQPGPLASGPVRHLNGYGVEVGYLGFSDTRSQGEMLDDVVVRRMINIGLVIRAEGGDPDRIRGIDNLRLVDQDGRDVLDNPADGAGWGFRPVSLGAFPDERGEGFAVEWPYPTPHRLRLIEGELVLYRSVRRLVVELPLPTSDERPAARDFGDIQVQLTQVKRRKGELQAMVRFLYPVTAELEAAGVGPPALAVLQDGTEAPLTAAPASWSVKEGARSTQQELSATGLRSHPIKIVWDLFLKTDADRRLSFRFVDYPAVLRPTPLAPSAPARRRSPK